MARTESIAVAGYFPTPDDQLPLIANVLSVGVGEGDFNSFKMSFLDPCAGDGEAIFRLAALVSGTPDDLNIYTCEMEASRYKALKQRGGWQNQQRALGGDAFRINFDAEYCGASLLYLNPPYDIDKVTGRLEEKFLRRFTAALASGGVLVFVVPYYALASSANTLATHYESLSCFRFRGPAFHDFKQVVLFAYKREAPLFEPDDSVLKQVSEWAAEAPATELPTDPDEVYALPLAPAHRHPFHTWEMRAVDLQALATKFKPWCESTRQGLKQSSRILPDLPIAELLHRTYEVATPPRPAHIAAGIAAGLFNGRRVEPDDASTGLPALLVKGVFDREWRTVEEKHNKDGEKTGEVQVQQPKLVVTLLDLDTHRYHTVASSVEESGVPDVSRMSIADLLRHYGGSLMNVMEQQCKILYDPRTDAGKIALAPLERPLYAAQAHAARATLTLLKERPGRQPYLLGEIGSGKTSVVLSVAQTHGARKVLAVCPPHLLDGWRNEVTSVLGWPVVVLESVHDVEAVAQMDGPVVAVLSREVAKLGHGWVGVPGGACPKCGGYLGADKDDERARKRLRCGHKTLIAVDRYAQWARELALHVRPYTTDPVVRNYLRGRMDAVLRKRRSDEETPKAKKWPGLPREVVLKLLSGLAYDYVFGDLQGEGAKKAIMWLFAAMPDEDWLRRFVLIAQDPDDWQRFVESLPLMLGNDKALEIAAEMVQRGRHFSSYNNTTALDRMKGRIATAERPHAAVHIVGSKLDPGRKPVLNGIKLGSVEAAVKALEALGAIGEWQFMPECDEPLFQAVPEPRRFPLAQYITHRHKDTFDFLVLDEGHEYATDGSAQERAAHRLTSLKLPTVLMTGSVMNGYATSLFTNMWALSPDFRDEFERNASSTFCDRYGYRKRYVSDRKDGEVVAFGSHSDRVERSERDVGMAPGVLPLFLFRHLLPSAVTLHKADLRIDLPELTQEAVTIEPSREQEAEYKRLLKALTDRIKADRFKEDRAGKLFGALSELPSYLDRATADVGNVEGGGAYEIRYPESLDREMVAEAKPFPASTILPKEKWMLDTLEAELAEGRNVMVFAWHVSLLPRLQRLIEKRIGEPAPILYADKVATGKRQAWIDREIVKKGRRVMIANPVAIQTGLNNLVHFHTEIWHENPACNPIVYRQAIGRIDRIGQKKPTRVLFATYGGSLQVQMYELLIAKVAVSTATDGLDPESALRASGIVEDEYLTGLSIGKQLWAMLNGEGPKPKLVVSNPHPKPTRKPAPELTVAPVEPAKPADDIGADLCASYYAKRKGEVAKLPLTKASKLTVADLNANEVKVLHALGTFDGAATIAELANVAFKNRPTKALANSHVRNGLRRLVREGMIVQVDRGTYAIATPAAEEAKS